MMFGVGAENTVPGHPEGLFGKTLVETGKLGVGPSMDSAVDGNFLYVIGKGKLRIARLDDPSRPALVSTLEGLGNTRQIEVADGIAYITSREDGLFLVDVANPLRPAILCQYDSIELATGIAVAGKVAFVACRSIGVELVDVADPRKPRHLSSVRTGEAQSLVARDGILYVGVWGSRELVVCDVGDPWSPRVLSRTPLDGFGDGVDIRGKYCYVATGHHARSLKKHDASDSGFGGGHGLECFDVTNPAKPVWISRVKLPRLYSLGYDIWDVQVSGTVAFVGDTYNGVFAVDISDPLRMHFVGHRQLDWDTARKQFGVVGGFAIGTDHLYVAGGTTDLHVIAAPGMATPRGREKGRAPTIAPKPDSSDPRFHRYLPGGQVYAVAISGSTAFVAAGSAGLHVVDLSEGGIARRAVVETGGFALDVKLSGSLVLTAEGKGGLAISSWENGRMAMLGRYQDTYFPVKQVVPVSNLPYALLQVGGSQLQMVDVSNPRRPEFVTRDKQLGLLYGYQISEGVLEDRWALCFWHVSGFHWYDLKGGEVPAYGGNFQINMSPADGAVFLDRHALAIARGGYFLLRPREIAPIEGVKVVTIAGHPLSGKPSLYGKTLYLANRFTGTVRVVDLETLDEPRLRRSFEISGNPGIVREFRGKLVIPAGYQGLLLEK
jgi:hypothetical protein